MGSDAPSHADSSRKRATQSWEAGCMSCDPFEGDYGGAGDRDALLSDKIVKAKIDSECHTCAGPVVRGQLARVRAEVYDGEFMRFRWCEPCCRAMAASAEDPDVFEARCALGAERRSAASTGNRNDGASPQKDHPHG